MKKLIIFVLLLNICFSQKLSAKIEKTTFGIDMDIPNDYVLVKKENYEQLKKIAEFSTQSQSQILKPSRETSYRINNSKNLNKTILPPCKKTTL